MQMSVEISLVIEIPIFFGWAQMHVHVCILVRIAY